ncbi:MAG TPA: transcription elongation factor GreA [Acidimicrobiia bacterium]|nr:transcription elongation factor GreA [Acidimicrobiia bacterium]
MDKHELTQEAFDRLNEELEWRTGKYRLDLAEMIEKAREHGDLKENGEYHAAKDTQGLSEARVRELEQILKNAEIVESAKGDVVAVGTVVEISMGDETETTTYYVGSIEEKHDDYDMLTTTSPLGTVLMGGKPGDKVTYEGPRATFEVTIHSVKPNN